LELRVQRAVHLGTPLNVLRALRDALASPRAGLWLVVLFLIPRALVLLVPVTYGSDAGWYFSRAVGLAAGEGYAEGGVPTAFWPPGWPLVLGMAFKVFGASVVTVKALNFLAAALGGWLTYDLGRRIFDSEVAGRAAVLLLAIYPNHIGYVPVALTEVFYTTLLLGACWLLIVVQGAWRFVAAGLVLGLASLVKAQSLAVVPLVFFVAWVAGPRTARRFALAVVQAASVIVVAALVIAPWSLRNHGIFGEFVPISTNGGLTLLSGNNPSARGDHTPDDPLVTSIPRTVATQLQVDREARARAWRWIGDNPAGFVLLIPKKVFRLWAPDGESEWEDQRGFTPYNEYQLLFRVVRAINQIYYVGLILGFLYGGFLLASGRARVGDARLGWWLLPYAMALYPTMVAMLFSGQSRFHFPVMPFIAMVCGWLIVHAASHREPSSVAVGGPARSASA